MPVLSNRSFKCFFAALASVSVGACQVPERPARRLDTVNHSAVDTTHRIAAERARPQPSVYPDCPVAAAGEPPALNDPYQFEVSSGGLLHTGLIRIEFVQGTKAAIHDKLLRAIHGCVEGRDSSTEFIRIATDTTGERQFRLTDSLRHAPIVDFAMPVDFGINNCMIPEAPREKCTDLALKKYLLDWRRKRAAH